jgi:hypothetical protein
MVPVVAGDPVGVTIMPVEEPGAGAACAVGHCEGSVTIVTPSGHVYVLGLVGAMPLFAEALEAAAVAAIAAGHSDGSVTTVTPSEHV